MRVSQKTTTRIKICSLGLICFGIFARMYIDEAQPSPRYPWITLIRMAVLAGLLGLLFFDPATLRFGVLPRLRRGSFPRSFSLVVARGFAYLYFVPGWVLMVGLFVGYALDLDPPPAHYLLLVFFGPYTLLLARFFGSLIEYSVWPRSRQVSVHEFNDAIFRPGGVLVLARRLLLGLPFSLLFFGGIFYMARPVTR